MDAFAKTELNAQTSASSNWVSLLRHGLIALGFALFSALGLTLASNTRWDIQLVYSLAIALITWLLIELGQTLVSRQSDRPWPFGPFGIVMLIGAVVVGYVAGTLIGDAYGGHSTWELMQLAPGRFLSYIVLAVAIAAAATLYFHGLSRDQQRLEQLALAQRDATQARLSLLQSQLEPHMLFNTLASLRLLIPEDPARALRMLDHLNGFLRATLSASRVSSHTLADEFALLADYLELMSVRMGPRLSFSLSLPPSLALQPIPPLLLQPLVENCVRHGLEPKISGGTIQVTARLNANSLVIRVIDDGIGLITGSGSPTMNSQTMNSQTMNSPLVSDQSFGLNQVRARLHSCFGNGASLLIEPASPSGTIATVTLPRGETLQRDIAVHP